MHGKFLLCMTLLLACFIPVGMPQALASPINASDSGNTADTHFAQSEDLDQQPLRVLAPPGQSALYYYTFVSADAFKPMDSTGFTQATQHGCIMTQPNATLVADVQFPEVRNVHVYWLRVYYRAGNSGTLQTRLMRYGRTYSGSTLSIDSETLLSASTSQHNGYYSEIYGDDEGDATGGITVPDTIRNAYAVTVKPTNVGIEICGARIAYRMIE